MTPWLTDYRRRQRLKHARREALEAAGAAALGAGIVIVWYLAWLAS